MIAWSYGGGVQSAAIAALVVRGDLPIPDLAVIADTGREMASTWRYLADVVAPALPFPIHVAPHSLAKVDLYAGGGQLLLPVFTTRDGRGRMPTYCSSEWKQYPVQRWLRSRGVKAADLWLGISTDEAHRMKPSRVKWLTHRYPLIEDVPMSRARCVALVESMGWPTPPKSRCWMCPHQSGREWQEVRDSEHWRDALALDASIQERDQDAWLHRACKSLPAAVAVADQQPGLFDGCDSGFCWT